MPFYEYQCKQCDHHLEAMQKVSDAPLRKCPKCGKSALQRLMSAPVFRLKGGGWYETDFKGDGEGKRNLADRPEADAPKDDKKDGKDAAKEATTEAAKPAEKTAPAAEKTEKKPAAKPSTRSRPAKAAAPARKKAAKRPKSRR